MEGYRVGGRRAEAMNATNLPLPEAIMNQPGQTSRHAIQHESHLDCDSKRGEFRGVLPADPHEIEPAGCLTPLFERPNSNVHEQCNQASPIAILEHASNVQAPARRSGPESPAQSNDVDIDSKEGENNSSGEKQNGRNAFD